MQAILNFGLAALNVPVFLNSCDGVGEDLHAIESWATIFTEPTQLTQKVTKNYLLHRKAIKADFAAMKADWAAQEYFKSGVEAADLLTVAVGPIDVPPAEVSDSMLGFTAKSIPDFVAGFLYGWTGHNNLTEIEACYSSDLPIA